MMKAAPRLGLFALWALATTVFASSTISLEEEGEGDEAFQARVDAILQGPYEPQGPPLFSSRAGVKQMIAAWVPKNSHRHHWFTNLASSVYTPTWKRLSQRHFHGWGNTLGEHNFVASNWDRWTQTSGKSNITIRATKEHFVTLEAFIQWASGAKAQVEPGRWAVGFHFDQEAAQVTMISVGRPALHLVLMEEDRDGKRLRPRFVPMPGTQTVVKLQKTPCGTRLRRYYVLVAPHNFLSKAAELKSAPPQELGHMEKIIEKACQLIPNPKSPPPIFILINLQEALPRQVEEGSGAIEPSNDDAPPAAKAPEPSAPQSQAPAREDELCMFPNPHSTADFSHCVSTIRALASTGVYSDEQFNIGLWDDTILFSDVPGGAPGSRCDSFEGLSKIPYYDSLESFRQGAQINSADESAVGAQLSRDKQAIIFARTGSPSLVTLVFKETSSGKQMLPYLLISEPNESVILPLEQHPREDRTCEYWLVFAAPAMAERLLHATWSKEGARNFYDAGKRMAELVLGGVDPSGPLFVFRFTPLPLPPLSRGVLGPPEATVHVIEDPQYPAYYVGRELNRVPGSSTAKRSFKKSGVCFAQNYFEVSRRLEGSEKGRIKLQELVEASTQPAELRQRLKGGQGPVFAMGFDRATHDIHFRRSVGAPLMLIRLQATSDGRLKYKIMSTEKGGVHRRKISRERPTIYAVVSTRLTALLPTLMRSARMPRSKSEFKSLIYSLDYRASRLPRYTNARLDWPVDVVVFTANMPHDMMPKEADFAEETETSSDTDSESSGSESFSDSETSSD